MKKITLFEDILIIDWADGQENIIPYVKLRKCPCAMCGGKAMCWEMFMVEKK